MVTWVTSTYTCLQIDIETRWKGCISIYRISQNRQLAFWQSRIGLPSGRWKQIEYQIELINGRKLRIELLLRSLLSRKSLKLRTNELRPWHRSKFSETTIDAHAIRGQAAYRPRINPQNHPLANTWFDQHRHWRTSNQGSWRRKARRAKCWCKYWRRGLDGLVLTTRAIGRQGRPRRSVNSR